MVLCIKRQNSLDFQFTHNYNFLLHFSPASLVIIVFIRYVESLQNMYMDVVLSIFSYRINFVSYPSIDMIWFRQRSPVYTFVLSLCTYFMMNWWLSVIRRPEIGCWKNNKITSLPHNKQQIHYSLLHQNNKITSLLHT